MFLITARGKHCSDFNVKHLERGKIQTLFWCSRVAIFQPVISSPAELKQLRRTNGGSSIAPIRRWSLSISVSVWQRSSHARVSCISPYTGSVCPADFQKVVLVFQQEVVEDESDGVSGFRQDGPRAVQVVVVLRRVSGAADGACGAS